MKLTHMVVVSSRGSIVGLAVLSFILSQAVPVFNYLLALLGTVCLAPLAMILPGWFWLHDNSSWRKVGGWKMIVYFLHWGIVLLGFFFLTGGTYATIQVIIDSYKSGGIGMYIVGPSGECDSRTNSYFSGSVFSCADNSNSS